MSDSLNTDDLPSEPKGLLDRAGAAVLTLVLSAALTVDGAFRIRCEGIVERMVNKS